MYKYIITFAAALKIRKPSVITDIVHPENFKKILDINNIDYLLI